MADSIEIAKSKQINIQIICFASFDYNILLPDMLIFIHSLALCITISNAMIIYGSLS